MTRLSHLKVERALGALEKQKLLVRERQGSWALGFPVAPTVRQAFERATERVERLVQGYQTVSLAEAARRELERITLRAARPFGMGELPRLIAG